MSSRLLTSKCCGRFDFSSRTFWSRLFRPIYDCPEPISFFCIPADEDAVAYGSRGIGYIGSLYRC